MSTPREGDATQSSPSSSFVPASGKYRRRDSGFLGSVWLWRVALPVLDAAVFLLALFLLLSLRTQVAWLGFFDSSKWWVSAIYIVSVLATVAACGGYNPGSRLRRLNLAAELILAVGIGSFIGFFLLYAILSRSSLFTFESRLVLILASGVFLLPAILIRAALAIYLDNASRRQPFLVLGHSRDLREFETHYQKTGLKNPLFRVTLDAPPPPGEEDISLDQLDWEDAVRCQAIILSSAPEEMPEPLVERLVRMHFQDLPVYRDNVFYASMWRQVPVTNLTLSWALEQDFSLAERSAYRYVKSAFDLAVSSLILLATWPLMGFIAVLIKLDSHGPVFYRQPRVGRQRREFILYKFRTMTVHPEMDDPYTRENDQRMTRVGRWLRKLRLDELPQLINVFKGDMHLIGPRAEWSRLVADYERQIPCYHLRHLVKPGITGWAQLNYPYGSSLEDAIEKLKYDLYYIKYYSPVLDIEIVLKTTLSIISFAGR